MLLLVAPPEVASLWRRELEVFAYRVLWAVDVNEAVRWVDTIEPDLLLLDVSSSFSKQAEATIHRLQHLAHIPVIRFQSLDQSGMSQPADYIVKNSDNFLDLLDLIEARLSHSREKTAATTGLTCQASFSADQC